MFGKRSNFTKFNKYRKKNPLKNLYKGFMNERSFKEFSFTIIHVLHAWVSDNAVGHGFSSIDVAHAHLVLLFL